MEQGYYAVITFLVPLPPTILLMHKLFDHINGTFGHAGFEYFASRTARHPWPMLCTAYHDQHHAEFKFKYNYANYFSFWDRVMGTIAPNYDRRVETFESEVPALNLCKASGQTGVAN